MLKIHIHPPVSRNCAKAGIYSTLAILWSWLSRRHWKTGYSLVTINHLLLVLFREWATPSTRGWKCSGDSGHRDIFPWVSVGVSPSPPTSWNPPFAIAIRPKMYWLDYTCPNPWSFAKKNYWISKRWVEIWDSKSRFFTNRSYSRTLTGLDGPSWLDFFDSLRNRQK